MRTARFRLTASARALSMALACLLALGALAPSVAAGSFVTGDRAIVIEGVYWQHEPGVNADFIVPAGDDVVILDGPVNGSYYIAWGNERGWLAAWALAPMDGGVAAPAAEPAAAAAGTFDVAIYSLDDLYGRTARVASAGGVNLRAAPGHGADVLFALSDGTVVELRIYEADTVYDPDGVTRWWPVIANGVAGWVSGSFLVPAGDAAPAPAAPAAPEPEREPVAAPAAPTLAPANFVVGDYIAAQTASGSGVNIREAATMDSARLGFVAEAGVVQIIDGPVYDGAGNVWYVISDGAVTGYVLSNLFVASAAPPPPPPPEPEPEPEPEPAPPAPAPALAPGTANGYFIWPTNGSISQLYGCSPLPFYPYDANLGCGFHNGLDIAAPAYTPIVASDGGVVTAAGWCDCGLGFYVAINHGNGFETIYGHMAEHPYVAVGQAVSQGEVIGPIGSTGVSTGPHIHFMIKLNGSTVDPLAYLS